MAIRVRRVADRAERRAAPVPVDPADATDTAGLMGWTSGDAEPVTRDTALAVSAVWACVRLLSDTISTLPVDVFRRVDGQREPYSAPEWLGQPNPDITRIAFIGQLMTSLLLEGNAYVLVSRVAGRVVALDVIPASMVDPRYVRTRTGRKQLVYQVSVATEEGAVEVVGALSKQDVVHIVGLPLAGELRGVSPIKAARETIGLAMAAQSFGAEFFANGALPGAVVEVPGPMTTEGLRAARQTWRTIHGGKGNRHGLAVLTEGARFTKVSVSPDEAQFLQTRQFQVPDIARIYGIPPHLIADASNSTSWGSGLAEQNIAFAQHSIRPWIERLELAFTRLLGADGVFVKFNLDSLLRGSLADRIEVYRKGIAAGLYTRNEVRAWEDLPPDTEFGDFFQMPLNVALLTPDGPLVLGQKQSTDQAPTDAPRRGVSAVSEGVGDAETDPGDPGNPEGADTE